MILDGNGRWAIQAGWRITQGHKAGADAMRHALFHAIKRGVKVKVCLTCFNAWPASSEPTPGPHNYLAGQLQTWELSAVIDFTDDALTFSNGKMPRWPATGCSITI